jgi:hypothetical protein
VVVDLKSNTMAPSVRSIDVIAARNHAAKRSVTFAKSPEMKRQRKKKYSPPSPASAAAPRKSALRAPSVKKEALARARVKKVAGAGARVKKVAGAGARVKKAPAGAGTRVKGKRIDFSKIRWGTFTRHFKAWRKRAIRKGGASAKRARAMKNLKQFSKYVLAHPKRFSLRLRRKAQFYLNIILKGGKRAPRPVKFSPVRRKARRVRRKAAAKK